MNKANVTARLKEIRGLFATDDEETREEAAVLDEWLKLSNREAELKKKLKDIEADLDAILKDRIADEEEFSAALVRIAEGGIVLDGQIATPATAPASRF